MTSKEILKEVKVMLGMEAKDETPKVTPEIVEISLKEITLKDGTILSVDKMEVGGVATIDGNPAVGEFELEDGSKIITDETGTITEIKPMKTEEPEVEVVVEAVDAEPETEKRILSLEEKVKSLEDMISKLTQNFQETKVELSKVSDQPLANPVYETKETKKENLTPSEAMIEKIRNLNK